MKEKQEKPTHKSPPNGFTSRKMGIKRCGLSQSPDLESKTQNKGLISGTKWCANGVQSLQTLKLFWRDASAKHFTSVLRFTRLSPDIGK